MIDVLFYYMVHNDGQRYMHWIILSQTHEMIDDQIS